VWSKTWLRRLGIASIGVTGLGACSSTVHRAAAPAASTELQAQSLCERRDWLVAAPTFARVTVDSSGREQTVHGLGVYRVGEEDPLAIPSLPSDPEPPPTQDRKVAELEPHDTRSYVAIGLGVAGTIAMAVGAIVAVSAFESRSTDSGDELHVNKSKLGIGGLTVGLGFGLGITGLVINPSHADRTRASAQRYVFAENEADHASVVAYVEAHNRLVRELCLKTAGAGPAQATGT
jgi:hypothetical protein